MQYCSSTARENGISSSTYVASAFYQLVEGSQANLTWNGGTTATSLGNLALLRMRMGDFKAALPLFEKASEITKAALGEGHPHHATALNNLAALRQRTCE